MNLISNCVIKGFEKTLPEALLLRNITKHNWKVFELTSPISGLQWYPIKTIEKCYTISDPRNTKKTKEMCSFKKPN
jgi:hypothetical protein